MFVNWDKLSNVKSDLFKTIHFSEDLHINVAVTFTMGEFVSVYEEKYDSMDHTDSQLDPLPKLYKYSLKHMYRISDMEHETFPRRN